MTGIPLPRRRALLLGCGTFADRSLPTLRSPRSDVEQFGNVLRDRGKCRYAVTAEVDCTSRHAQRTIEGFFADARVSDGMNLLYLSCHGVQDARGQLYFAFTDTERAFLNSTAVSADWVREQIYASRSRATLVLIDCCFSGAFIKGMRARSSAHANVESLVQDLPAGSGMAVLTASGETEVSFEDSDSDVVRPSYFTEALIRGIASGSADLNRDGRVTVDELYDYIYDQVVSGPSPQRPRRLGMGEGVLVVSDAPWPQLVPARQLLVAPAAASPGPARPTPLVVRGVLGWVSFDGQWVVIGKNGVGHIYKGERRYHINQLFGVAVKPATRLHYGYFQILVSGSPPMPVVRFGLNAGRPPLTDDNSISFAKAANDDVGRLRDAVQYAIGVAHGLTPTTAPAAPASPDERSTAPLTQGRRSQVDRHTATHDRSRADRDEEPPSQQRHQQRDPAADPTADYRRGEHDGARTANRLPLAAFDSLTVHQFDVVRWLVPWRQHWQHVVTQPQPATTGLPAWLPAVAQYLGGYAAPPGSTNSAFTPSPAYLAGFCAGLRTAWATAVTTRLLPADRPALVRWLTQPPDQVKLPMPPAEATLDDLRDARRRAYRVTVIRWTLRSLLWAIIALLILMEIIVVGISVDGSFTDANGQPAANQAPYAVFANMICLIPLIALVAVAAIDLRRLYRTETTKPVPASASPISDQMPTSQQREMEAPRQRNPAGGPDVAP